MDFVLLNRTGDTRSRELLDEYAVERPVLHDARSDVLLKGDLFPNRLTRTHSRVRTISERTHETTSCSHPSIHDRRCDDRHSIPRFLHHRDSDEQLRLVQNRLESVVLIGERNRFDDGNLTSSHRTVRDEQNEIVATTVRLDSVHPPRIRHDFARNESRVRWDFNCIDRRHRRIAHSNVLDARTTTSAIDSHDDYRWNSPRRLNRDDAVHPSVQQHFRSNAISRCDATTNR